MTQTSNRFFDEIARLMNDAAGVASGVRREFDTLFRAQAERMLRELAIHDWIVVSYLTILTMAVAMSDDSPVRSRCLGHVAPMLAFCVAVLALVRGGLVKDTFIGPLAYRVAVYGTVQISYFELRELLPLVNPTSLDAKLSFIDGRILHFEPSLFMDRFVTSATTEWFAFFYFGYFALLASHVLPMVFVSRRSDLVAPFALGMIFVYAMAHTLYMVVPGYGPVRYLADRYQHELPSGVWLNASDRHFAYRFRDDGR